MVEYEKRFPGSCPCLVPTNTTTSLSRVKFVCLHCVDCSLTEGGPACLQTPWLYLLVLNSSWVRDESRMAEFQQFALPYVLSLPGQPQHVVPNETNSKWANKCFHTQQLLSAPYLYSKLAFTQLLNCQLWCFSMFRLAVSLHNNKNKVSMVWNFTG